MTPSGDVWSLGTTLVEVLTQHLPEWQPGRHVEPTFPATLPAPFLEIARQALRVDPQRRITIADISAQLSARAVMASAAGAGVSISAVAAAPPVPHPVAPKPVVSQAVPPRPPARLKPAPRPPLYHGESRPKSRFIVPLIVGALVFAGIITVPRLLTHRPADASAPPAASGKASSEAVTRKAAPVSAAGHPDSAPAKPEQFSAAKKTATAVVPAQEKSTQGNAPPAVEPVKTASNREQPSDPAATAPVAPEKVARTAVPGSGSAKGEVLDQVLPDVSQKARDTIQGKVRVSVKVHVDPSGAVSDAELDSPGPSKFFADLAMEAAKKWVFSPPEIEGKSVASEWRLRFDFRQKETKVTPTQTAP
jgi:periplasmic protein TonB